jgi:hypothetical protein
VHNSSAQLIGKPLSAVLTFEAEIQEKETYELKIDQSGADDTSTSET